MLQLNYDNKHTFLVSVGIILLIFGLYIFYVNNFVDIGVKILMFHIGSVLLGFILVIKGMILWGQRDKDKLKLTQFLKSELKTNNELVKIRIKNEKLAHQKNKNEFESILAKEKLKEGREKIGGIEEETKAKLKEIEKLDKSISQKQDELLVEEAKILEKREESIEDLPDTLNIGSTAIPISGSNSSFSSGTSTYFLDMINKKCRKCGNEYSISKYEHDIGYCFQCRILGRYDTQS